MLKLIKALTGGKETEHRTRGIDEIPPDRVHADGAPPFAFAEHLRLHEGLPIPDWEAVEAWCDGISSAEGREAGWSACERAWLLHMRAALGDGYRIDESPTAAMLSSLTPTEARATLDYIERTIKRVTRILDGIARPPAGKDLLLVFDDEDTYYRYVSYYYPDAGEFAFSGGIHLADGHFVTVKAGLQWLEPVVAHELTRGCLVHLPLPAWLKVGLAVNAEQQLVPPSRPHYTPQQMRDKHLAFWNDETVQQFWSGQSFFRPDDGNMLSHDLARILVEQMAKEWETLRQFVLAANADDGGARAARESLGLDLGEVVCALMERPSRPEWSPNPQRWEFS